MRMSPNRRLAIIVIVCAIPTAIAAWSKLTTHERARPERELDVGVDDLVGDDPGDQLARFGRDQARLKAKKDAIAKAAADADARAAAQEREAHLGDAFGHAPGMAGPMFGLLDVGAPLVVTAEVRAHLDAYERATGAHLQIDPDHGVTIDYADPRGVRAAVEAAWGAAAADRWLDSSQHVRAAYTEDAAGAHVAWSATESPRELISPMDPVVFGFEGATPFVGGGEAHVHFLYGAGDLRGGGFHLAMRPVDWASSPVDVDLDVDRGVVTAMHIRTNAPASALAITGLLAEKYGRAGPTWRRAGLVVTARRFAEGVVIDITRSR
jgi:hypothetical protein